MMQWSMHMTKSTQNTIATYMSNSQPKYLIRNTCSYTRLKRVKTQEYYFSKIIYNSIINICCNSVCPYALMLLMNLSGLHYTTTIEIQAYNIIQASAARSCGSYVCQDIVYSDTA